MKVVAVILAVLGSICILKAEYCSSFRAAMHEGAQTTVALSVMDDEGAPVSNATVVIYYSVGPKRQAEEGKTDGNGVFLFSKITNGFGEVSVKKSGYYDSKSRFSFIDMGREHEVVDGVWQPCPMTLSVLLRKIVEPCSLIAHFGYFDIPVTNVWLGFDMKANDWTAPFGVGTVPDFELYFEWDGKKPNEESAAALTMRIPQSDEPCAYLNQLAPDSSFPHAFRAETNLFDSSCYHWSRQSTHGRRIETMLDSDKEIIVRTRCETNSVTGALSYLYARVNKISFGGGWKGCGGLSLGYALNPVRDDVNLEQKK